MKPSSSQEPRREGRPLDITLDLTPRVDSFSYSNRRLASTKTQRFYPWLLCASTAVAAVFCFAYITKPVVYSSTAVSGNSVPSAQPAAAPENLITKESVPTNKATGAKPKNHSAITKHQLPPAPLTSGFEETNIRMQHILDAESTSGDINRIVIDVPVLYKSRNLRWSQDNAAQARVMLQRLEAYQEKSRTLREEGKLILEDWNKLMDESVPNHVLRADSPSISSNLLKSSRMTHGSNSEAVKIQRNEESP